MRISSSVCLLAINACQPKYAIIDGESTDATGGIDTADSSDESNVGDTTEDDDDEDTSEWDGSSIEIRSPISGSYLPLGELSTFEAVVMSAEGDITLWDEFSWSSDLDADWLHSIGSFQDDTLSAGSHNITAEAVLPNGDHLSSTVGAIRVQHTDTGIYVGTVTVEMAGEISGTEFSATCVGATTIVVDETGEEGTGDTTCLLSFMGYDMETTYDFELDLDEGEVTGDATADLDWFEYDFEVDGSLDDERITATWDDDVYGLLQIAGDMDVERVTQDVSDTE